MKKILFLLGFVFVYGVTHAQKDNKLIKEFQNANHPQIAYWFFSKTQLDPTVYKQKIDSLTQFSKYTLVFLTARNGVDFFDPAKMKPIFSDLVQYAHSKGLKIGLQLWGTNKNTTEPNCERAVVEQEVMIDSLGKAEIYSKARHIRAQSGRPFKSDLLKAFAFKKTAEGFYEPASLKDITNDCKLQRITDSSIMVSINLGTAYKGYTVYLLSQHYYPVSSNHSQEAIDKFVNVINAYADIPFDGVGLDEYTNLKVFAPWELKRTGLPMRERLYSLAMAKKYKQMYQVDLENTLFDMRYAPADNATVRIKAINSYMDLMRRGTLNIETAVFDAATKVFGPNTFVGLHDSHHNHLDGDEVWQTGLNWWNIKRLYGHTDEETPTSTQMGIAFCYPKNILYNMFYHKQLDVIEEKAYNDLAYGIRTHYHAINDVQNWGVSVEQPQALEKINRIENCARLLNHFNPALPEIKLLVVFGREALLNWYPNVKARGDYDVNTQLKIEEKSKALWKAGYLNALVPTDVIEDGRLKLQNGKAVLNGHSFDAVIFLYPEYAKESSFRFLEQYVAAGGKLMVEGTANYDFKGNDVRERWNKITAKAVSKNFDATAVSALGISKQTDFNVVKTEDGSYIIRNYEAFKAAKTTTFKIEIAGNVYEGQYCGYVAMKADKNGIVSLAATALQELKMNGKMLLLLDAADVLVERKNGKYVKTIASTQNPLTDNLK